MAGTEEIAEGKEGGVIKNKETVAISIRLPKWVLEDSGKACQNYRQFQNGDGSLNVNKYGIEAFILKNAEMRGDKVCVPPGMLVATFPKSWQPKR